MTSFSLLSAPKIPFTSTVSCWDAASEFNDSENPDAANPSGVWSYGSKKTLTDKFFLASRPFADHPDSLWLVDPERISTDLPYNASHSGRDEWAQ